MDDFKQLIVDNIANEFSEKDTNVQLRLQNYTVSIMDKRTQMIIDDIPDELEIFGMGDLLGIKISLSKLKADLYLKYLN